VHIVIGWPEGLTAVETPAQTPEYLVTVHFQLVLAVMYVGKFNISERKKPTLFLREITKFYFYEKKYIYKVCFRYLMSIKGHYELCSRTCIRMFGIEGSSYGQTRHHEATQYYVM